MPALDTWLRLLAAAYLVAAVALASYWGAARLSRGSSPLARWCAVPIVGMSLATLGFHLLAPLHLFTLPAALAAVTVVLAAVVAPGENRRLLRDTWARDRRAVHAIRRRVAASPHRGWIAAFAICTVPALLRPLVTAPVSWDAVMYHLPKAAFWVQQGGAPMLSLDPGVPSWLLTRNHLAGGEVFLAWAMLPMHGDFFAGLPSVVHWVGLGLALIFLAREIGVREPFGTAAAGFIMALAPIRLQVGSGYVELTLALLLAAGIGFTIRAMRTRDGGALILALAAMGLACAVKIIALPVAALVFSFVATRAVAARRGRALAAGLAAFVALAAPWFVYNTLDTGAPLSPAAVSVAGVELGRSNPAIAVFENLSDLRPYDWDREWTALTTTFDKLSSARESVGWPMLIVFAVFLAALPLLARRCWHGALLLLLVFIVNLAVVYSPAFTPWRQHMPESFSRFMLPAILVATPASGFWLSRTRHRALARAFFLFLLAISLFVLLRYTTVGVAQFELDGMLLVLAGIGGLWALGLALRRPRVPRAARVAALGAAGFLLLGKVEAERDGNRVAAMRGSQFLHPMHRQWVDPARTVDTPGSPQVVAITHGVPQLVDTGLFYFLFGRELQNRIIHLPVTRDGSPLFNPWHHVEKTDYARWSASVIAEKVDWVVTLQPVTVEQVWMERHGERFRRIYGYKNNWGIYKVIRPTDTVRSPARDERRP